MNNRNNNQMSIVDSLFESTQVVSQQDFTQYFADLFGQTNQDNHTQNTSQSLNNSMVNYQSITTGVVVQPNTLNLNSNFQESILPVQFRQKVTAEVGIQTDPDVISEQSEKQKQLYKRIDQSEKENGNLKKENKKLRNEKSALSDAKKEQFKALDQLRKHNEEQEQKITELNHALEVEKKEKEKAQAELINLKRKIQELFSSQLNDVSNENNSHKTTVLQSDTVTLRSDTRNSEKSKKQKEKADAPVQGKSSIGMRNLFTEKNNASKQNNGRPQRAARNKGSFEEINYSDYESDESSASNDESPVKQAKI